MVVVAIAALDFAAIRAIYGSSEGGLLVLGALPMAHILAVGLLISRRRPGSRPFLLGFETFGAMALALFVTWASCCDPEAVNPYLDLFLDPLEQIVGQGRPFVFIPIAFFGAAVMLGWPQVVFALIGGFLSRRFKITITRR
jgi:hypothetical protein